MLTGVPADGLARAGIWRHDLAGGSASGGADWPSVSCFLRSAFRRRSRSGRRPRARSPCPCRDQHGHRRPSWPRARLRCLVDDRARPTLSLTLVFCDGSSFRSDFVSVSSALNADCLADHFGHDDVRAAGRREQQERAAGASSSEQRDQPPRQPRLLAEDALGRHQRRRPARAGRRAPAQLEVHLAAHHRTRVDAAHLRAVRPAAPRNCGIRTLRPPGPICTSGG